MNPLSFLHSFVRNFILYFGPIIIIVATIIFSLSTSTSLIQSLEYNNFYQKISQEAKQLKPAVNANDNWLQNQSSKAYEEYYWSKIGVEIASPEFVKKTTNTNIENFIIWLNQDNSKNSNPSNFSWQLPTADLQKQIGQLPTNLEINQNTFVNTIPQINNLYNFVATAKNFIWFVLVLFVLSLVALVIISPIFGKNLFVELGTVASRLGINTLFFLVPIFIFLYFSILSGGIIKNFVLPIFAQSQIVDILSSQLLVSTGFILLPCFVLSAILIIGGFITKGLAR